MKVTLYLSSLTLLSGVLTSCYSNRMLVDDDVYVMKNAELPVGESLTDETNYSTYRYKKDKGVASSAYYYDPYNIAAMNYCDCNPFLFTPFDCGWGARNYGYSGLNDMYYGYGYYNAFGHYYFGPGYMNYGAGQYGYFGNMYSPYYNPYGGFYFGTSYSSPYFSSNAFFYNTNPYGYNSNNYGNSNNYNNSNSLYNGHSGPRGSLSGYTNSGNRNNSNLVKSHAGVSSNNESHTIVSKPLSARSLAGQNVSSGKVDVNQSTASVRATKEIKPTQSRPVYTSSEVRTSPVGTNNLPSTVNARGSNSQQRPTNESINRGSVGGNVGGGSRSGGASRPTTGVRRN